MIMRIPQDSPAAEVEDALRGTELSPAFAPTPEIFEGSDRCGSAFAASRCGASAATRRRARTRVSVLQLSSGATPLPRLDPPPCAPLRAGVLPARTRPGCDATFGCRRCGKARGRRQGAGLQ